MDALANASSNSLQQRLITTKQIPNLEIDRSLENAHSLSEKLKLMHAHNSDDVEKDSTTLKKAKLRLEILLIAAQLAQILYEIWKSLITNIHKLGAEKIIEACNSLKPVVKSLEEIGFKNFIPDFKSLVA
jgi:hypothetical protein